MWRHCVGKKGVSGAVGLAQHTQEIQNSEQHRKLFVCYAPQNISLFVESGCISLYTVSVVQKRIVYLNLQRRPTWGVSMASGVSVFVCVWRWGMGERTENVCVCSPWEGVGESVSVVGLACTGVHALLRLALDERLHCAPSLHIHKPYQYGG